MTSPHLGLAEQLAPAAEAILRVIENDQIPDRVVNPLGTALLIIADTVEDEALGLTWATPEQRVSLHPHLYPEAATDPAFDPDRCTPHVQAIYAAEIQSVRLAPAGGLRRQLQRSAYALGRIVAAGALPAEHVRESLAAAAADLPAEEAAAVIDAAILRGLSNPRALPKEKNEP